MTAPRPYCNYKYHIFSGLFFSIILEKGLPIDHAIAAPALSTISAQCLSDQYTNHHLLLPTTTTTTNTNANNNLTSIFHTIKSYPSKPAVALHPPAHIQLIDVSRSRSSSLSSKPITANGVHHVMQTGEDSSQSSLNLSASSGYLSGSSANSSVGGNSNLNISVGTNGNGPNITAASVFNGQIGQNTTITMNGVSVDLGNNHLHSQIHLNGGQATAPLPIQPQNIRRRTISSNSNG